MPLKKMAGSSLTTLLSFLMANGSSLSTWGQHTYLILAASSEQLGDKKK